MVGHLAVQPARWKGAAVTGTASGRNAGFLRELGVEVFDYASGRFEKSLRDLPDALHLSEIAALIDAGAVKPAV